jgi:hypothetical protein
MQLLNFGTIGDIRLDESGFPIGIGIIATVSLPSSHGD